MSDPITAATIATLLLIKFTEATAGETAAGVVEIERVATTGWAGCSAGNGG